MIILSRAYLVCEWRSQSFGETVQSQKGSGSAHNANKTPYSGTSQITGCGLFRELQEAPPRPRAKTVVWMGGGGDGDGEALGFPKWWLPGLNLLSCHSLCNNKEEKSLGSREDPAWIPQETWVAAVTLHPGSWRTSSQTWRQISSTWPCYGTPASAPLSSEQKAALIFLHTEKMEEQEAFSEHLDPNY